MSNVLKVSHQETIRSLHETGWSDRRIARELGINRRTVNRHGAKCTIVPTGKSTGCQNQCDPFAQAIRIEVEGGTRSWLCPQQRAQGAAVLGAG